MNRIRFYNFFAQFLNMGDLLKFSSFYLPAPKLKKIGIDESVSLINNELINLLPALMSVAKFSGLYSCLTVVKTKSLILSYSSGVSAEAKLIM